MRDRIYYVQNEIQCIYLALGSQLRWAKEEHLKLQRHMLDQDVCLKQAAKFPE